MMSRPGNRRRMAAGGPVLQNRRSCRGFTLIELLIVIMIISVLMGILLVVYRSLREQATKKLDQVQMSGLRTACEIFNAEYGDWPRPPAVENQSVFGRDNFFVVQTLKAAKPVTVFKAADFKYNRDGAVISPYRLNNREFAPYQFTFQADRVVIDRVRN